MTITVAEETFSLDDNSKVNVSGYDLEITEPGFDKSTSEMEKGRFVSKPIILPPWIKVNRTSLDPCSGLYKDANGKRRFTAYFD
jgi:hypothetical protein